MKHCRGRYLTIFAVLAAISILLNGCGKTGESREETARPVNSAATEKPQNTDDPIIVTRAPTEVSAEPADDPDVPKVNYVDLLSKPEWLDFSASSTEAENSPSELSPSFSFDGDPDTRWSSIFYDVEGCWICVQFAYPVIIHGVDINENKTWGQMLGWEAQYYDEAAREWKTVYSDETSEDESYEFLQDTPETYAFRLYFLEGTGITVTINEIGVYGLFAEVPEGTEPHEFIEYGAVDPGTPEENQIVPGNWTYTASSREAEGTDAELGPELCFDGNKLTRWSTVFGDLYGAWIAADFGEELTISGFLVNECKTWGHVTSFEAQVMAGGEWKTVYTGADTSAVYVELSGSVTTTAFRLLFNDGETLSETVTIWEIELYK